MKKTVNMAALQSIILQVKKIAAIYRNLTGKPLGVTGEIGEFVAADLLNLKLTKARCPGYDALGPGRRRIQIKARCIQPGKKSGQIGGIKIKQQWDSVVLIIMDEAFEPTAIYEAKRKDIQNTLSKPGSKARNERGSLTVSKFKSSAQRVW